MKSFFEENDGTYTKVGEYLIPDLVMDSQPEGEIGIWGQRRKQYLKKHRKGTYKAFYNYTLTNDVVKRKRCDETSQSGFLDRMAWKVGTLRSWS